jgi:hypothetical protein
MPSKVKTPLLTLLLLGVNTCGARDSLKVVNELTKASCKTNDVSNLDIIRAIFWILSDEQAVSPDYATFAISSLSGKELA